VPCDSCPPSLDIDTPAARHADELSAGVSTLGSARGKNAKHVASTAVDIGR